MSSKSTIFSLNGLEHWYQDCTDNTIALEFEPETISESYAEDGLIVYVKMDSQLGKLLYHPEVRAIMDRVAEQQNAEEAARYNAEMSQR